MPPSTEEIKRINNLLEQKKTGKKVRGPQNLKNPNAKPVFISRSVKLSILTPGQCFGMDDLLADCPQKASMICTRASSFYYQIPR